MKKLSNQEKHKQFLPFIKAREFVQTLKIRNHTDWITYGKSGKLPDDIPSNPNRTYKKEWKGWGDWLGTGTIAPRLRKYRTCEEAKKFVHSLGLKNQKTWLAYSKSERRPDDIPANPESVYKNKGWKSLGDWLGTGIIATFQRKYRSFEDAREFAHSLGLTGANEWREFTKSNKKPDDISTVPNQTYKNKGWISWGDWLGTGIVASYNIKFREFNDARIFARSQGLKSVNEWRKFSKSGNLPNDVPHSPNFTYKNKGWVSWGDFLGTGTISTTEIHKQTMSWKEAKPLYRKIAKENKITTRKQWEKFVKIHKLPKGLPLSPASTYSKERIGKIMK